MKVYMSEEVKALISRGYGRLLLEATLKAAKEDNPQIIEIDGEKHEISLIPSLNRLE